MEESLKNKTVKGTIWSSIERFSVQGIQFIVMIIMARILTPEDYGLIGMLTVFIAISQSLVESGFSQALVRKLDRSEVDNSTVFYFNVVVGCVLYVVLFLCAPVIARFYKEPILIPITRLISLSILINSFVVVQRATLTIKIDFKTQAKASFIASIASGAVGISLAKIGYGVWSIVWYQLTNLAVNVGLLWVFSKWRPKMMFSWKSFHELFGFGSKLALSGIIDTLYRNIYLILIGKVFSAADLGYYTRAHQFADFPSSNVSSIIQRVTYPVLCTLQNENDRLREVYRKFLRLSAFIIFPLMTGLAAVAHPFITIVLTDKWDFAAVLLQIICFSMMWYPIHSINLNLLQVKGRSDLFLKLEIYKKIVGATIICITVPFGLIVMCLGSILTSILSLIINTYYTGKLIDVGFIRQMKDLFPIFILSLFIGVCVFMTITYIPMSAGLALSGGVIEGVLLYTILSKLFRFPEFTELLSIIQRK